MVKKSERVWSVIASLVLAGGAAAAQDDLTKRVDELERKNAELEGKLDALSEEQERFVLGDLVPPIEGSQHGLGPAASKVYSVEDGLSIGGYGEGLYQARNGSTTDELDFLRAVLYFGYRFSEHWVFNSEIEFEHAGEEVSLEFAYLDYLWRQEMNFRAGLLLVPMGFLNELHEPNTFLAATRPVTEQRILPSTWRENGVGVFGDAGPIGYRAYVVNGFDALGFDDTGLRGGRQSGSEAMAEDFAGVVRADWTATPGLLAGGSVYQGDSGQDQAGLDDTPVFIAELHAEWHAEGLWLRALGAMAEVDDVSELNTANGFVGNESVGEEMEGYYFEAGYDVLGLLAPESTASLSPYARFEAFDTQSQVPPSFSSNPANDEEILTVGLNFQPIPGLVFKVDYQDADQGPDGVNAAMGYSF